MAITKIKTLLQPATEALRIYWPPILVIQALSLAALVAYYQLAAAAGFFAMIGTWKAGGGMVFAAVSTVISGGVIPEILKRLFRPRGIKPPSLGELANQFAMWAGLGILIDAFYGIQSRLFGDGTDPLLLIQKVALDQLVWTPLVSLPYIIGCFLLHESRYRIAAWLAALLSFRRMSRRILTLWTTCLSFWPVMLLIVYSLPLDLQFPLFLFANSAYSILMVFIIRRQGEVEKGSTRGG